MKQNGTVQKKDTFLKATIGQVADVSSTLASSVLRDLSPEESLLISGNKKLFNSYIKKASVSFLIDSVLKKQAQDWIAFYKEYFGYSLTRSRFDFCDNYHAAANAVKLIFGIKPDINVFFRHALYSLRLLVIPDISLKSIITAYEENFDCFINMVGITKDNIDEHVTWNACFKGEYGVLTNNSNEAVDPLCTEKEYNLLEMLTNKITLKEHLIHVFKYSIENKPAGIQLDWEGATVCLGTRINTNLVPMVYWCREENRLRIDVRNYSPLLEGKTRRVYR